ncbi:leucine carboxyl methyltransferase [Choiromyces venosus 120613-1]|uniref:Leucine carboxyl methyltransferase 1 n=1 Tax=Choiromyces venosus 120613-1 TaxID=1336337 RepID=A0A3N4J5B6_9PEZI|nr:leucine carboxyl methyltransferase [Choiromyces venosus 120613-1]
MNPVRFPKRDGGSSAEEKDRVVQQTDQDASQSRLSAVDTGYLEDPFARLFVAGEVQRRYPLINRGTYIRTTAIDKLVNHFLVSSPETPKQIISLGAGSDTRFFRIASTNPSVIPNLTYHELDFQAVTSQKIASISTSPALQSLLSSQELSVDQKNGSLTSRHYSIHPLDIRTLRPSAYFSASINTSLPTLFISECCLIYLSPTEADAILKWITTDFTSSVGIILYEPIGGDDAFGRVMIQNLAARGIVLKTLKKYSSLERQVERLRVLGFTDGQLAVSVKEIHDGWVSAREKGRIAGLEMLDEVEEWDMLAAHYCVAWGWRDGDGVFAGWGGVGRGD